MRNPLKRDFLPKAFGVGPEFAKPRFPWVFGFRPVKQFAHVYYLWPFNYPAWLVRKVGILFSHTRLWVILITAYYRTRSITEAIKSLEE